MKQSARKGGTNTIKLVLVFVGFVVLAYYATITLTTRDPLWFLGRIQGQPSLIVVYHAGQRAELRPGQPGFDELAGAVQASLAEGFARLSNIGFSEGTLQDAYTRYVTLEIFFDQPVELHTWFPTGRTAQMLFPITGRHSEQPLVLLGEGGSYRAGAPVLNTVEPIHEALQSLGYYEP